MEMTVEDVSGRNRDMRRGSIMDAGLVYSGRLDTRLCMNASDFVLSMAGAGNWISPLFVKLNLSNSGKSERRFSAI